MEALPILTCERLNVTTSVRGEWSWHVNSIVACCHSAKLCTYGTRDFRSQHYLPGSVNKFLNFCVGYFSCCFLKIAIKISHNHFVHVAFVSILVFQTFDQMIFRTLTFPGTRWYVMTVRQPQMVHHLKNFENHCCSVYSDSWGNTCAGTVLPSFEHNWLKWSCSRV